MSGVFVYRLAGTLEDLDHLTPALWDAGAAGLEEGDGAVFAYFPAPVELPFGGEWAEQAEEDWLAAFRASIRPVTAGSVTVLPSWLAQDAPRGATSVVIDPGMAFGTGQHETTFMALLALQRIDYAAHPRLLDVGTGSGLLAIAAAKLGAASVAGTDIDEAALAAARENAAANGVQAAMLGAASPREALALLGGEPFDVVVANLYAELHASLAGEYRAVLRPAGRLVLTGILAGLGRADQAEPDVEWSTSSGREMLVREALAGAGFMLRKRDQQGEWVLLEAEAPS